MSTPRTVVLDLTLIEAAHLAGLVDQFRELLSDRPSGVPASDDPAIARLVPDGYPDDDAASREFRALTEGDLLRRRAEDAVLVLEDLSPDGSPVTTEGVDPEHLASPLVISLDHDHLSAWLRTLAAIRLVLASRLGIDHEDDHDEDDPRFGIYDWLGYRLDGLVAAAQG
jgi:hypothetical protein